MNSSPTIETVGGLARYQRSRHVLSANPRRYNRFMGDTAGFALNMTVAVFWGALRWDERARRYIASDGVGLDYEYVGTGVVLGFDDHHLNARMAGGQTMILSLAHHFAIEESVVHRYLPGRIPVMGRISDQNSS